MLGAGIVPCAVKYHFVALRRIQDRTATTGLILGMAALFEIACSVIGARQGGVLGLSLGWLFAGVVQALAMSPALARTISRSSA